MNALKTISFLIECSFFGDIKKVHFSDLAASFFISANIKSLLPVTSVIEFQNFLEGIGEQAIPEYITLPVLVEERELIFKLSGAKTESGILLHGLHDPAFSVVHQASTSPQEFPLQALQSASLLKTGEDVPLKEKQLPDAAHLKNSLHHFSRFIIGSLSPEGIIVDINKAGELIWGRPLEQIIGCNFSKVVGHEDLEITKKALTKARGGEVIEGFRNRNLAADGRLIEMEWSITWSEESRLFTFLGNDVTHKIATEADLLQQKNQLSITEIALEENQELIRATIESALDAVVVFDDNGKILKWNPRAEKTFGFTKEEQVGKHCQDLLAPGAGGDLFKNAVNDKYIQSGEVSWSGTRIPATGVHKSGRQFDVEITLAPVQTNGQTFFSAFIRDISKQKIIEQCLHDREQQIEEISSSIPGVVFQFCRYADGKYHFNYYSKKVAELTGVCAEDIYADINKIWNAVHPDDLPVLFASIEKSAAEVSEWQVKFRVLHPSLEIIYIQASAQPTAQPDGSIIWNGAAINVTEIALAELKIAESEKQFRLLLETIQVGILQVNKSRKIIYANPQMCAITGYSLTEMLGQEPGALFRVFEDRPDLYERHTQIRKEKINSSSEVAIYTKDGKKIWLSLKASPLLNENGEIICTIASHQDITEQKQAREQLLQSEERHRALFQKNPLPMWVYDITTLKILAVNRAAINHYQYTEQEFLDLTLWDLRPKNKQNVEILQTAINRSYHKDEPRNFIVHHVKKSGEIIDVHITASEFIYQEKESILVVAQDITEEKKAESERQRLTSIIEATSDLISIFNTEGKCMYLNPAGQQLLQSENNFYKCISATEFIKDDIIANLNAAGRWEGETILLNRKKEEIPVSLVFLKHLNADGTVEFYSAIARDISEQKKTAHALEESKARYKSLFELSPEPQVSLDKKGNIIKTNLAYRQFFPQFVDNPTPAPFLEILDPEMRKQAQFNFKQVLKGNPQTYNAVVIGQNQKRFIFQLTQVPIKINGQVTGSYVLMQDETNLFHTNQELQQSHRELRELSARIQVAQEEERKYISREIHDELGQILTALNIDVTLLTNKVTSLLNKEKAAELYTDLTDLKKISKEAILSVKRIVSELRPIAIDEIGLPDELRLYLERFQARYAITTNLSLPAEPLKITTKQAIEAYRIVQEALTNVARHSKASTVNVEVAQENQKVMITIKDNGIGISQERRATGKSFGLIGMRERALMLGGNVRIETSEIKGTTINLELPSCEKALIH